MEGESTKKASRESHKSAELVELDESLISRVIARLPVLDFIRYRSVSTKWNSFHQSPTFLQDCHEIIHRPPWFFMLDSESPANVIYDAEYRRWIHITLHVPTYGPQRRIFPVAASGGLMCSLSDFGHLKVYNPITGLSRQIQVPETKSMIRSISMHTSGSSYKILVIYGGQSRFGILVFSSTEHTWIKTLVTKITKRTIRRADGFMLQRRNRGEKGFKNGVLHRTPAKVFTGVTKVNSLGHEVIHYLDAKCKVVSCDTCDGTMVIYPPVLPEEIDYAVDLVECGGRILVVVIHEVLQNVALCVFEFDDEWSQWRSVAAMPPIMSRSYYGRDADINCVGHGNLIMVCLSNVNFYQVVMCNIDDNSWVELPPCFEPGDNQNVKKFVSAYCFEPRIEATV